MLQLLDLARENAALKCELAGIRAEAEALKRHLVEVRQILATRRWSGSASQGTTDRRVRAQADGMLAGAPDPWAAWKGR